MGQCRAKSKRSGVQCKNWAIRKKVTCRFHGGFSTGPRTKEGKKNIQLAHLRHGFRTKQKMHERTSMRNLIKTSMNVLQKF